MYIIMRSFNLFCFMVSSPKKCQRAAATLTGGRPHQQLHRHTLLTISTVTLSYSQGGSRDGMAGMAKYAISLFYTFAVVSL